MFFWNRYNAAWPFWGEPSSDHAVPTAAVCSVRQLSWLVMWSLLLVLSSLFSPLLSSLNQCFHFSVVSFVSNSLLLSSIGFVSDLFSYLFVSDQSMFFILPLFTPSFLLACFHLCVCVYGYFSGSLPVSAISYIVLCCTIGQFQLRPLHGQF